MKYRIARPLLFAFPPETAHCMAMEALEWRLRWRGLPPPPQRGGRRIMGLTFANPVGLAAGFDKNAAHINAVGSLGFGFIEVGGVTPKPQPGNPQPRIFRLPQADALINRMGFNNVGAAAVATNLKRRRFTGVVGVNLGKNADSDDTAADYSHCLEVLYPHGDFFTVNISSPNTKDLRDWQHGERLNNLLSVVAGKRNALADQHGRRAPLAIKIAPDLDDDVLPEIAAAVVRHDIDAVVACNTTTQRPAAVRALPHGNEKGGLSGKPLAARTTAVIKILRQHLPPETAIIGVGGIFSAADADEKIAAGADLVQLYTGLVYRGPNLVTEVINRLAIK